MTGQEYIPAALRTECQYEPVMARLASTPNLLWHLLHAFTGGIRTGENQSRLKRALFYGDQKYVFTDAVRSWAQATPSMHDAWEKLCSDPRLIRLVHSLLGQMDEVAEKQQALFDVLFNGKSLDEVNGIEESGDLTWYQAVENDVYGLSFEEAFDINIAKLRQRYPERFTEFDAIERNLTAERQVLEEGYKANTEQAEKDGICMSDWGPGELEAWNALSPEQQKQTAELNLASLLGQTLIPPDTADQCPPAPNEQA